MTFVKPDLHDFIGVVAFTCMGLLLVSLVVAIGMTVTGFTPAWFKPTAVTLSVALPTLFAVCVVLSEVVR
jgi:hypothetical protein